MYVSTGVLAVRTEADPWVASSARAMWTPADTWHEHRMYGLSQVHTTAHPPHTPGPHTRPRVLAGRGRPGVAPHRDMAGAAFRRE
ncbi:hypothetical protein [Streptomyces sp. Ac-502]|uniref:hypothetical protein n=1 Tax=Streptomyces sp. Ac-502 TaxID=3342801 RepID=UPI0038624BF5